MISHTVASLSPESQYFSSTEKSQLSTKDDSLAWLTLAWWQVWQTLRKWSCPGPQNHST